MKLRKELSLVHVFCIASGAMISSGIFVLPGLAHVKAGPAVVVSYFLAGLLASIGMLNVAEMATAMPKAGGEYFFVTRSMGPAFGTMAGLLTWFFMALKSSFALVGIGVFSRSMLGGHIPALSAQSIALVVCVFFIGLNVVGTRSVARLQVGLVVVLFSLMGIYVVMGLPAVRAEYFDPVLPNGLTAVFSTAGFVFVAYGGLLKVSSLAEEIRNPGRIIPLGMMLSLFAAITCYTLMVLVTTGVLPGDELDRSLTPISDGARVFMGPAGSTLMTLAAACAFITTANAGILAASRYLLALSRDELAPAFLRRVNPRFRSPHYAIAVTGGLMLLALCVNLDILVKGASTALILNYALSCVCVMVLRESQLQNYRPKFHAPLYPWIQIVGLLGFTLLIFQMGIDAFVISSTFLVLAFSVYWFYGRKGLAREYALLHLIERVTSRKLVTGTLESELKDIIYERDDIVLDRFDLMTAKCPILDLTQAMPRDAFFEEAARIMSERVGIPAEEFLELLQSREEESSTALHSGLAIPHIVLEQDAPMEMLIARCLSGVHFSEDAPTVRTIIVLAGPRSERNFHLQCLAAISQIVQSPDFDLRWENAQGEQGLRDVFLLGIRRRK